jgi:hypothetical protein
MLRAARPSSGIFFPVVACFYETEKFGETLQQSAERLLPDAAHDDMAQLQSRNPGYRVFAYELCIRGRGYV